MHSALRCTCWAMLVVVAQCSTWQTVSLTAANAVCLDGTPGIFWLKTSSSSTNWLIVFEGGGWCYSAMDCVFRSLTYIGTSKYYTTTPSPLTGAVLDPAPNMDGPYSVDCTINPEFCDYNIVELHYCDGFSFLGDTSFTVGSGTYYSRGRVILQATLDKLLIDHGLASATKVLLSGGSAGGTSALANADYVHSYISPSISGLQTYKVLSLGGIFPTGIGNVDGTAVFSTQIQAAYALSGASANVDSTCSAALGSSNAWKCATGEGIYPYVTSNVMVMGSAYDKWQAACIFGAKAVAASSTDNGNCSAFSSWEPCLGPNTNLNAGTAATYTLFDYNPVACTSDQVSLLGSTWRTGFLSAVQSASTYTKAGNGAFLHSCYTHVGEIWDGTDTTLNAVSGATVDTYNSIAIGDTTLYAAIRKWWAASSTEAASTNTYTPCEWSYQSDGSPLCNPTCPYFTSHSTLSAAEKAGIAVGAMAGVVFVGVAGALAAKGLKLHPSGR